VLFRQREYISDKSLFHRLTHLRHGYITRSWHCDPCFDVNGRLDTA